MIITFVDDSIPFDGHSPASQPLGSAEKAFAHLPVALSRRGHAVRVYNRCEFPVMVEGVSWQPIEGAPFPAHSDVLVAYRKPSLLRFVEKADHSFLWLAAPAGYLDRPKAKEVLEERRPMLLLQGLEHQATLPAALMAHRVAIMPNGVGDSYAGAEEMAPARPPRAVATTHPLAGLDWLLELWTSKIQPRVPWAELHVFSAALDRGADGAALPEDYRRVLDQALAAEGQGVRICRPEPDPEMVEVYRTARVHLYPGHADEIYCGTLAESQAVGLPAVARPLGATAERIVNGQTGYLAPDDEAFANLAVRYLDDDDSFARASAAARASQRSWTWDKVAAEFEALVA